MFQVPANVWQAIAKTGPAPTTRWARAMAGGQPAVDALLAEVDKEHEVAGIPNKVSLAFQVVAPLLVENERIQAYLRQTDKYDLTQVLLDLLGPEEAAEVGALEYRLTPEQKASLIVLLSNELGPESPGPSDEQDEAPCNYELLVDRAHVVQGLRAMRLPRRIRPGERAGLGFDGVYLTVEAFDQMFVAHATGLWPGNASVAATLIAMMEQVLPPGDPLLFRCDGKRVSVGTLRIDCQWQPVSESLTGTPAVRDWIASLALKYTLPRGRIVTGGLAREIEQAERKLAQLVARVARSLAPLGVTADDVRALVERRLEERRVPRES